MVGLGRFELPTSPLSGVRSNQLSYRPARAHPTDARQAGALRSERGPRVREERETKTAKSAKWDSD